MTSFLQEQLMSPPTKPSANHTITTEQPACLKETSLSERYCSSVLYTNQTARPSLPSAIPVQENATKSPSSQNENEIQHHLLRSSESGHGVY
jgi:hypothetical protein